MPYSYNAILQTTTIASCSVMVQLKSTGVTYQVLRAWAAQSASVTSAQVPIQLVRKSTPALVAAFTPIHMGSTNDPASSMVASSCSCGTFSSTSLFGTNTDVLYRDGFNVLNGWLYLPVPEERILITAGGCVALEFPIAVTSESWEAGTIWSENK